MKLLLVKQQQSQLNWNCGHGRAGITVLSSRPLSAAQCPVPPLSRVCVCVVEGALCEQMAVHEFATTQGIVWCTPDPTQWHLALAAGRVGGGGM